MTKPFTSKVAFAIFLSFWTLWSSYAQEATVNPTVKELHKKDQINLISFLEGLESEYEVTFAFQKKNLVGKYVSRKYSLRGDFLTDLSKILSEHHLGVKKVENIDDDIYIIFPLRPGKDDGSASGVKTRIVSGYVSDEKTGVLLPGVNVVLYGTRTGAITDENGHYTLEVPDNNKGILSFSYVGFATLEKPLFNEREVNAVLTEDPQQLPEVVITALGISREQKSLGYAVSSISTEQLNASGNTNFVSSLYGKAPGVRVRTSPGGATSAVTMQIRGINSLNYNTQPLYVIDGVLLRDANETGALGVNNSDYFTDQRIRGNGVLDINPADIESLTILKGASATALYGSDAASGVVVITTKRASRNEGFGLEFNYTFNVDKVAFTPKFQNTYGPGFSRDRNLAMGATEEGWVLLDLDNDGTADDRRPLFESYAQFGPKMNGEKVLWWDGTVHSYQPQPDNYNDFYRTGYNSLLNVAFSDHLDKFSYRFSFTRNDNEGVQVGGKLQRNLFGLNSSLEFSKRVSADLTVNYVNNHVHNRPLKINRLTSSWSGYFSRAEDMDNFFNKYKTSAGYKWVPFDQPQRDPEEALMFTTPRGYEVLDFLWKQLANSEDEIQNRLISSLTLNVEILKNLRLRGRIGRDYTSVDTETKDRNEYPVEFNQANSTGSYGIKNGRYSIFYSDVLATYTNNLSSTMKLSLQGGFQVRDENYSDEIRSTNGGLVVENWFSLRNSYNSNLNTDQSETSIFKYAFLGLANLNFKDQLFLEITGRQEYTSTLPPDHNYYFYPSVNTSWIFSDALNLPSVFNFGKLRASYGIVGNAPPAYEANISYDRTNLQTINGTVISGTASGNLYGNDQIKSERKHELELGLEVRMWHNRFGFDLTYYDSRTKNQILNLDLPTSTGAARIITNVGELQSRGWEFNVTAVPVSSRFVWSTSVNAGINQSKVNELMPGLDQLVFRELEGSAIKIVAEAGEPIGNIYVYPRKQDENGNFIISNNGLYVIDKTRYVRSGNVLPKVTAGMTHTFMYKRLSMDLTFDASFGGKIVSPPLKYGTGSGMYESTLKYRDEKHGGLPYYEDSNGNRIALPSHDSFAPNGSTVYHDGIVLRGITEEGVPNEKIIDAATYYLSTFDWGNNAWNDGGAVYDNDYIKMREAVLSYALSAQALKKLKLQHLRISVFGRNLLYVWRTLENLDPESTIGTSWLNQGIDEGSSAATRSYGFMLNIGF